jgi:hypothetical protein
MPRAPVDRHPGPPRRGRRQPVEPPRPEQWPEDGGASPAPGWLAALGVASVLAATGAGIVALRSLPEYQRAAQPAWALAAPQPPPAPPPAAPAPEPVPASEPSGVPGPPGAALTRFAGADAEPAPIVAAAPPDAASADGAGPGAAPASEADEPATAPPAPAAAKAAALFAALMRAGERAMELSDVVAARSHYERAAALDPASAAAALAAGETHDPHVLALAGATHPWLADAAQAAAWYERARALGDPAAAGLLARLR